jgi:ubiquinone/menaquinone biosynthesis C-methylase UbiE
MNNRDLLDYQEQYSKQPYEKYQVAFRKRKIKELLSKYDHTKLLEVGCGLESIFLDLDSFKHLTVIEPAEMFYVKALEDATKSGHKNINVIKALLEEAEVPLKNESFNFILVSSLLHEIPDQAKFLKALHTISSADTVIHINVPNAKSFHRLLAVEMGLIKSEFEMSASNIQFQQQGVFDLDTLKKIVTDNNFEVVESGTYSFKPFTHQQMQNMINISAITEEMLNGFYKMERYLQGLGSEVFVNIKKK